MVCNQLSALLFGSRADSDVLADVTLKSGPEIFFNHTIDGQLDYLQAGYRVRVIKLVLPCPLHNSLLIQDSTWRPLLSVCKDNPLAFCDASTIDPTDLIAVDRVYPHSVGEVYYLVYNEKQQW